MKMFPSSPSLSTVSTIATKVEVCVLRRPVFVQKLRQYQTTWDTGRYGPPPAPRAIFRLRMPRAVFDNFQRKAQSVSLSGVNWTWRDDSAAVVPHAGSISSSGIRRTWDLLRYRSCPSMEPRGITREPGAAIPRHYYEMCSYLQRHSAVFIRCHLFVCV